MTKSSGPPAYRSVKQSWRDFHSTAPGLGFTRSLQMCRARSVPGVTDSGSHERWQTCQGRRHRGAALITTQPASSVIAVETSAATGQTRRSSCLGISASPPTPDLSLRSTNRRFGPQPDSCAATNSVRFDESNLAQCSRAEALRGRFQKSLSGCNSSSSVLASFRSNVSKPSVKQP
jgi:hypothetical protein